MLGPLDDIASFTTFHTRFIALARRAQDTDFRLDEEFVADRIER
jgi:hypothetical protein